MPQVRCPICDRPIDFKGTPSRPFCSVRCQQIDLGRWLDEKYSVPFERIDDEFDEFDETGDVGEPREV